MHQGGPDLGWRLEAGGWRLEVGGWRFRLSCEQQALDRTAAREPVSEQAGWKYTRIVRNQDVSRAKKTRERANERVSQRT
jgi:hypothetical protein